VGDTNRTPYEVGYSKNLKNLLPVHPEFVASTQVVADAIVAAQYHGSDQAQQFFGLLV
jgi:hypothetical protein